MKHKAFYPILVSTILVLFFLFLMLKSSKFNNPIPDVSEIPQEVKESIKNLKPQKNIYVPILLYHYVEFVKDEGDTIRKSLNIIPPVLDAEIKTLKNAGYTFITPSNLADALDDKNNLPEKLVILTFDDGYRDFYTDVFPILKKNNVKAVAFIVPNFLNKPNNMDSWMLKELVKSGLVEIGAHTMDHVYLTGLPRKNIEYEIIQSKKFLEKLLGVPIVSFAYPYGAFDNQAIDVVKKADFKTSVTTIDGRFASDVNRYFLYRVRPGGLSGQDLLNLLEKPLKGSRF